MQSHLPNEALVKLLELPDNSYFEFNETLEDELGSRLMFMHDVNGTAIGIPDRIITEARRTLPILWAARLSTLRSWQVEWMRNSVVIVSDMSRGQVSFHNALAGPKPINYGQVPKSLAKERRPDTDREQGSGLVMRVLDLRSVANVPWSPRRLAVTMLIYDWKSNTEIVTLTGSEAMDGEIAPRRRTEYVKRLNEETPAKGEEPGAVIDVPQTGAMDTPIPVTTSIRAPREDVVLAPDMDNRDAFLLLGTVILFKLDVLPNMPLQADMAIPAEISRDKDGKEIVGANFEFDIHDAIPYELSGTYQSYFVFGTQVLGPYPLTFEKP